MNKKDRGSRIEDRGETLAPLLTQSSILNPQSSKKLPPAIFLMGPTASGKTGIAVELAARLPVELISVDSAMVYRGMDIGTAKPSLVERASVPQHLIDICDPKERYSAAQFCSDAKPIMSEMMARGKIPLLVGGTMLYFHALQHGLSALPEANAILRAQLWEEGETLGWDK